MAKLVTPGMRAEASWASDLVDLTKLVDVREIDLRLGRVGIRRREA